MNRKFLAASFLMLIGMTGCARTVYTETYAESDPLVVRRTVYVDHHRPHYYRHRPYSPRTVVVVRPRPHYHQYHRPGYHGPARREEHSSGGRATVRAHGDIRVRAEASAR